MSRPSSGKVDFLLGCLLLVACSAATWWRLPDMGAVAGDFGLCLPSPNNWHLPRIPAMAITLVVNLMLALMLVILNRIYNYLNTPALTQASAFLLLTACNPLLLAPLSTPTLLGLMVMFAMYLMCGALKSRRPAQQIFIVGTILSIGSMAQYAFVLLVPVFLLIAIAMRLLNFRHFLAFGLGLCAPYWCALGLGIITPADFRMPQLSPLLLQLPTGHEYFFSLLQIALTALVLIIIGLTNAVKSNTAGREKRLIVSGFNWLSVGLLVVMIADFGNVGSYATALNIATGVQVGISFANAREGKAETFLMAVTFVFLAIFVLNFVVQ